MDLNPNAKWSEADQIYLFRNTDGNNFIPGDKVNVYGKYYWRWKIIDGNSNQFAFVYKADWENEIKRHPYYRTVLTDVGYSQAGGKVFASRGKAIDGNGNPIIMDTQEVYAL